MGWHGNRHSGGVKGTKLARAACPVCGRDTAGGNVNREHTEIVLKPHKRNRVTQERARAELVREWCPGGGRVVRWR
jgi:hypothetical protein